MKMFEYMSSKKAIISSDLLVIREVLNEKNSILVSPSNAYERIKAIRSLKEENFRNTFAKNDYNDYKTKYTWGKLAKNILENIPTPASNEF